MKILPNVLRIALVLLAMAGIGTWAWRSFGPAPSPSPASSPPPAAEPEHLVLVTYFTSNQRCPTCVKIETQTRKAVTS